MGHDKDQGRGSKSGKGRVPDDYYDRLRYIRENIDKHERSKTEVENEELRKELLRLRQRAQEMAAKIGAPVSVQIKTKRLITDEE